MIKKVLLLASLLSTCLQINCTDKILAEEGRKLFRKAYEINSPVQPTRANSRHQLTINTYPEVMLRLYPIELSSRNPITEGKQTINVLELAIQVLERSTSNIENVELSIISYPIPEKLPTNPYGLPRYRSFKVVTSMEFAAAMLASPDLATAKEIDPSIARNIMNSIK
jgi:hypothetical protein